MRNKTVCFTGHRALTSKELEIIDQKLFETIENLYFEGYTNFIAGGAVGFDTLAARAVLKLRERYPEVTLFLALPCPNQDKKFSKEEKEEYKRIKELADSYEILSEHYTSFCMHVRNRYMVDNSSCIVAFYRGTGGGTGYTLEYASKKLPYIINLAEVD